MKLSLVVSQGVHQGKVIPVPVAQFLIGRDEGCQLRPASAAISKKHCAILIKEGKVFVRDFESTNGTFVNDEQISGEIEVKSGDTVRVGPLEFQLKVEASQRLPASRLQQTRPSASGISRPTPPPKDAAPKEEKPSTAAAEDAEAEQMAALLLATDDGSGEPMTEDKIPSGSTVFEMHAVNAGDPNAKPDAPKPPVAEQDNSKRAADILKKYMQRPRT